MGMHRAENQQAAASEREGFGVHWAVFLPTGVIAVLYGVMWLWFAEVEGTSGGIARAALLVLAVGVPLLVVHAALRFANGRLELGETELIARPGWPVRQERHVAYAHIVDIKLRRGLIGRSFDVGSLVITDRNGDHTVMPDLADPQSALRAVQSRWQT